MADWDQKTAKERIRYFMAEQRDKLLEFEKTLGIGPVEAAKRLKTPYDTYKCWKNESNVMPGAAYVAIELLKKTVQ